MSRLVAPAPVCARRYPKKATLRFYAELNDLLSPERRMVPFELPASGQPAIKDMIESAGVPHTEVDLILANGETVDFSYRVQDGDRISVYPVFESLDITPVTRVRPTPLRRTRFILDVHLGRLAAYLRMLGFDTLYRNDHRDRDLARISREERRILLTRDRGLLKRSEVTHGHLVREANPWRQVLEVVERFDLARSILPFTRCLCCNAILRPASRESVARRLPERTRRVYDEFRSCAECGRIYWKGAHYRRMWNLVEEIRATRPPTAPKS